MGRYYCGVKQGPAAAGRTVVSVGWQKLGYQQWEGQKERKRRRAVAIEKLSFNKSFASDWEKRYTEKRRKKVKVKVKKKKMKNNTYQRRRIFGTFVRAEGDFERERERERENHEARRRTCSGRRAWEG
ncbi:hypothetical protein QTP88_008748 [Uroleucon formosanum]